VAGYETVGRAAVAIGPDPYLRGFHVTGTIGTLGAAAACARLLALEEPASAVALSLAATQAAGLKSNFGTMTKSLHAGSACRNGLLAALLAKRGFTANTDALEAGQGLAAAHGGALDAEAALAEPPAGWHLRENLFKYHASCFLTHAVIDAIGEALASGRVVATDVEHVGIHVSELELGACAIPAPADALQVKFSMAHLAAMALLDRNMSAISDEDALDPELIAMRARVALIDDAQPERPRVEVALRDGSVVEAMHDATTPEPDLELQRSRLAEKFTTLAAPVLGGRGAAELLAALQALDGSMPVGALMSLTAPLARA
jgi:2-methylcitrate dehydratase PrpD